MTARQFVNRLHKLGYTTHTAHELLGIGRSAAFNYASGKSPVPPIVEKLLSMYERHGVPAKKQ